MSVSMRGLNARICVTVRGVIMGAKIRARSE